MYLFGSARLATTLAFPVQKDRFECGIVLCKFGRVCRVSRVHVPCILRDVSFKNQYVVRLVQIPTWYELVCNFGFVDVG